MWLESGLGKMIPEEPGIPLYSLPVQFRLLTRTRKISAKPFLVIDKLP